VSQAQSIEFAMDELSDRVIMKPPSHDRIGNAAFEILIDGQVQIRDV